ncbi:unnamed protein product [Arctogadus glacialis]
MDRAAGENEMCHPSPPSGMKQMPLKHNRVKPKAVGAAARWFRHGGANSSKCLVSPLYTFGIRVQGGSGSMVALNDASNSSCPLFPRLRLPPLPPSLPVLMSMESTSASLGNEDHYGGEQTKSSFRRRGACSSVSGGPSRGTCVAHL